MFFKMSIDARSGRLGLFGGLDDFLENFFRTFLPARLRNWHRSKLLLQHGGQFLRFYLARPAQFPCVLTHLVLQLRRQTLKNWLHSPWRLCWGFALPLV